MDTAELVTVEVVRHSGAIIVTGLLSGGPWGPYFHSETFHGYSQGESIELFIDRHGDKLVTD